MMTRRQALKTTALVTVAAATVPAAFAQTATTAAPAADTAQFLLPALPYAYDALEPHIDAETMHIHHDKHHATYVANLNKAIADYPALGKQDIETLIKTLSDIPEKIRTAVRNQGGGHYNHTLFWQMMKKDGGGEPAGPLAKAIETSFGDFAKFKAKFTDTATKVFGSGWAWLIADDTGLSIESTPNQDTLLTNTRVPLLGIDVWEHAYYLKYQNKRADYITAWWNVVNWDFATDRYSKFKT